MPVAPTSVLKSSSYLGLVKINYKAFGFTYRYWLDTNDRTAAISKLSTTTQFLQFLIPLQAEIYDAVVHMGDSDIDGIPAISTALPSRSVDIITPVPPGGDPVEDGGFEPNYHDSALYVRVDSASWSGKLFWRMPPDPYVSGDLWVGPEIVDWVAGGSEPTFTANTSSSPTKVAGTYVEHLRHHFWRMTSVHKYVWKQDPDVPENYLISPMSYIYARRPTKFKMGRAFLPSQRR